MNARKKIDKLIIDHQKEFGFHSNFDFMNELLSEIEEERDEFAAGFAEWLKEGRWREHPLTGNWARTFSFAGPEIKTTKDLLEQYKNTL